jgi:hypothetical protein
MDYVSAVILCAERAMVGKGLELIGRGRDWNTDWKGDVLINLSIHININGHATPSHNRPRPGAKTGTGSVTTYHPAQFPQISIWYLMSRHDEPHFVILYGGGAVPAMSTSIPPIPLSATGTGAGVGVGATILTNPQLTLESANRTRNMFLCQLSSK